MTAEADPDADPDRDPAARSRAASASTESGTEVDDGAVLAATDLGHRFGDVTVFEGVSVALRSGTVTAVVGPNGSGKTTLLRVVAGLLEPTSGSVRRAGTSAARPVGYLPQRPSFRPAFTVRETLAFYGELAGEPRGDGRVADRLDAVGLSGVADRRVAALSGGMVRLLGLAQATVGDPPLLVIDEPTSGLDPELTEHVFSVVEQLADGDRAVLLAGHDLDAVERSADEVLVLDRGGLLARGSPADLLDETGAASLRGAFSTAVGSAGGTDGPAVRAGRREGRG